MFDATLMQHQNGAMYTQDTPMDECEIRQIQNHSHKILCEWLNSIKPISISVSSWNYDTSQ